MKKQAFVLFAVICLAGCATHHPATPTIVNNVGKTTESENSSWPTLESNRASFVLVEYHILYTASGFSVTESGEGLVVGPHTIITDNFAGILQPPQQILQGITIRSVFGSASGDWSGVPATIVARLDIGFGLALLTTNDDLPGTKPITFGVLTREGPLEEGYRFGSDNSLAAFNVEKTVPVLVGFEPATGYHRCYAMDNPDITGGVEGTSFDMRHRLVCGFFIPAQDLVRFLLEHGVSVVTK